MKLRKGNTILFPMVLFCVFACGSFLAILYGIDAYQTIEQRANDNFAKSTPLAYLTNKVRSQDESKGVRIENIQGKTCLVLTSQEEEAYRTLIYFQDHKLYELLIPAAREVNFSEGTPVMNVSQLDMKQEQNKITFTIKHKDTYYKQQVILRSSDKESV